MANVLFLLVVVMLHQDQAFSLIFISSLKPLSTVHDVVLLLVLWYGLFLVFFIDIMDYSSQMVGIQSHLEVSFFLLFLSIRKNLIPDN